MTITVKTFSYVVEGYLNLQITATEDAYGKTTFHIECIEGKADINALYWNDGDAKAGEATMFGFTGAKSESSLNMNGSGEAWDGGIKLSDAGLKGLVKPAYLCAGQSVDITACVDLDFIETLGIRATSTSTPEGSIKAVMDACVPHKGDALFTENFDGYAQTVKYFDPANTLVFATVDLQAANQWQTNGISELGADGYGTIPNTSPVNANGNFWLDTQNTPGQINISHAFQDLTAAVGGKTAVLEFDIAKQSLNYLGNHYETDGNAEFRVLIDGHEVTRIKASDLTLNNTMYHQTVEIEAADYNAGTSHTITLEDVSPNADVTGFSIDSIKVSDWVCC